MWHPFIIMRTGLLTSSVLNLNYSPQIDTFVCGYYYYYYYYQFFQRRVPQKAKMPVQGGPQKQTDKHTYNYNK